MGKKRLIRAVVFCAIAAIGLYFLCDLFETKTTHMSQRMDLYHAQEKNTVDGVIVGSSGVDRFWVAAQAFEDYGMTVLPLSTDGISSWLMLDMVKEAFRNQSPKLVIIDGRCFVRDPRDPDIDIDVVSRRVIDILPFFSSNRLEAIQRTKRVLKAADPESQPALDISYFFSFIRFHGMWEGDELTFDSVGSDPSKYLGMYMNKGAAITNEIDLSEGTDERIPLDDISEEYLRELIDYLKGKDCEVLFLITPHEATRPEYLARYNSVQDIVESEGIPCMFYTSKELMAQYGDYFDEKTDFYNSGHTNYVGAKKFTTIFAEYLHENYDLPDHREDERCAEWFEAREHMEKRYAKLYKKYGKK